MVMMSHQRSKKGTHRVRRRYVSDYSHGGPGQCGVKTTAKVSKGTRKVSRRGGVNRWQKPKKYPTGG